MEGMSDIKSSPYQVKIGSGQQMTSTVIGTKHVMAIHKDGTRQELKLKTLNISLLFIILCSSIVCGCFRGSIHGMKRQAFSRKQSCTPGEN